MLELLESYDKRVAAGILARAALALANGENFDSKPIVDNERELRAALIEHACSQLGLNPNDRSEQGIERIGSYFDAESDRLIGEPQIASATERLIQRGNFPSDLYNIQIIPEISIFFGKDYGLEKSLIERTVRTPFDEQHFGTNPEEPTLISLFAREFKTPYRARNFTMLVVGQRGQRATKNILHVHQAWRLYEAKVSTVGARDLVELLHRFADFYGCEIAIGGKRDRFYLITSGEVPKTVRIYMKPGKGEKKKSVAVSRFVQRDATGKERTALVTAIDLGLYRATLEQFGSKNIT